MNRTFQSIAFLILLTLSVSLYYYVSIILMNRDYKTSYGRSLENKFDKLRMVINNKIVILGGSNVAFGIDSDLMERLLEIPVVNMGLHASFYTYVIIEPVVPYMREGDVLIISREFVDRLYGSTNEVANYFGYMPFKAKLQVIKNMDAIAPILKCTVQNSQNNILSLEYKKRWTYKKGPYSYQAFRNDNISDNVIDFTMTDEMYNNIKRIKLNPISDEELIEYYRNLYKRMMKRRIKVYLSMPSIVDKRYSKSDMIGYYEKLSQDSGIPLLSSNIYAFPQDKMFNTWSHLNKRGRIERSLEVSRNLSHVLGIHLNNPGNINMQLPSESESETSITININDVRHGSYLKNKKTLLLEIDDNNKNIGNNYYRFKSEGDVFRNKFFKIIVEGDSDVLNDMKFRAVGPLKEWDEVNDLGNNQREFIKYVTDNIKTYYKNNYSYIGITISNLKKHNGSEIIVKSMEISDEPFVKSPNILEMKKNVYYMITMHKSSAIEEVIRGTDSSDIILEIKHKYVLSRNDQYLFISDLYLGNESTIVIRFVPEIIISNNSSVLCDLYEIYNKNK